jgi:hypothetical protein
MVHSLEFEFLDDAQGGPFVAFGGPIAQLRGLLARNDVDTAVRFYEETRGASREELLQEMGVASLELKKSIAVMFKKALPMFAELSMDDMRALFRICVQHGFGPGMHLIEPGQPGRGLFLIIDGIVDVFGSNSADARLLDAPTSARVTARTNVKALFISREAFHRYVAHTPTALRLYRLFSTNLAERVRTLSTLR